MDGAGFYQGGAENLRLGEERRQAAGHALPLCGLRPKGLASAGRPATQERRRHPALRPGSVRGCLPTSSSRPTSPMRRSTSSTSGRHPPPSRPVAAASWLGAASWPSSRATGNRPASSCWSSTISPPPASGTSQRSTSRPKTPRRRCPAADGRGPGRRVGPRLTTLRTYGQRQKRMRTSGQSIEDVPADGAPALLIVENQITDSGREVRPLPLPFLGPSSGSVVGWAACASRPDGVRRSAQLMGGRREPPQPPGPPTVQRTSPDRASRGPRHSPGSRPAGVTHTHLTADPGSTDIDSLAGPAVTWLMILEQMQHVPGAQEGPVGQQSVFGRQSPPRRRVISRGSRSSAGSAHSHPCHARRDVAEGGRVGRA